jgi:putative transcriptional regulator
MGKPTRVTNKISSLRSEADMTQGQLAELIGVTRQTVNAMELAKYSPTLEVAFRVAQVFSVKLDDVFAYE